jgi:branched-chain amino acid transport system substrate-binding protein
VFTPLAEKAGIKVVATEYYQRADPSVTGQALRLLAAKPDAVLVAGVGGPGVLP